MRAVTAVDLMTNLDVKTFSEGRSVDVQRSMAVDLALKGPSERAIHEDRVGTLGVDATADSSVTRDLWETRHAPSSDSTHPVRVPIVADDADKAILAALGESPFASVRQFSWLTHLSPATGSRRLTQSLAFTACHLR
jgi:hypothetical protein